MHGRNVFLGQPFLQHAPGRVVVAGAHQRHGREVVLPRRGLVRTGHTADCQNRRACFVRNRVPLLRDVVEVDERSRGCIDLLAVDGERGVAADHHIDLFVSELFLGVLLDDLVPGVRRGVCIDAEGGDAERLPHGLPGQRSEDGQAFEVVEAQCLHGVRSRSASSTTGSISASPSTRSSRFATPAHAASES